MLSNFQDFKMTSTRYSQIEMLFPSLKIFATHRLVELVWDHQQYTNWCFPLTVLPAAWVFALKGFMLPKRHPKMSEPTPPPRQCPSTTQVEHPSFCLNLPWSFPKDQALYLFASKNWPHQRWYTSGIDLRIIHGSLWGSQVASVAQFLYCIWAFLLSPMKNLRVWRYTWFFMERRCPPIHPNVKNHLERLTLS